MGEAFGQQRTRSHLSRSGDRKRRIRNRWQGACGYATCLLALGLFGNAPLWLTVGLFAFYLFMAPAANNIQYDYPSEIFDTRVRGTGMGFSAAFSRISAVGATYLFPLFLAELGTSATLLLVSAFPSSDSSSPSSGHQKLRKRLCAKAEGSEAGKGRIPGTHQPLHHENALNTNARMPTRVT